jgi:hypothetical protein
MVDFEETEVPPEDEAEDEDDETEEQSLPPVYITLLSDSQGSQPVDIAPLIHQLSGMVVTVRNVLGFTNTEPGATSQIYLNRAPANLDTPVVEGDLVYIAGKLAGG